MDERKYPEWVQTESERKIHDSFMAFLWLLWRHLRLPQPTKRQYAIARYLQSGPRRRMIQAFRGIGKTWITCAYALWRLYRNPQERIKIVSANEDKAVENATFIRRLIDEVEQLQFLRPRGNSRDSVLAFDVGPADASVTPSVSCVGITGQLTGGRATILISDDVEVPKNSRTETMRELLAELVKEYDALVVPEGFDIIYLGTPQTEQSIYNVVRTRGYDCRIWPALFPGVELRAKYGGALAPDILEDFSKNAGLLGKSTDPERFSDLDLADRAASYGRSGFALQFMLDTSLSDAERYPLKTADLVVMDVPRNQAPVSVEYTSDPRNAHVDLQNVGFQGDRFYRPLSVSDARVDWQGKVMIVDPSGRGTDETSYAVLYHAYGNVFLMASGGFRKGYDDETLTGIHMKAKEFAVNSVEVESTYGDGMFTKLLTAQFAKCDEKTLKPIYACTVNEYKSGATQKEKRIIDDIEPMMNQHRLIVDRRVVVEDLEADLQYSLFYQMTHLTKERGSLRHEDRLEVVARGCRFFLEKLAVDSKRAEELHRGKLQDEELRKFMAQFGRKPAQPNFTSGPSVLRRRHGRPARR
jgi:hypothetical protein